MNIYKEYAEIKKIDNAVVTVGSFDGLHIGHQKIIDTVKKNVEKFNGQSCLITFEPHPRMVIKGGGDIKILTTLEEKIEILSKCGIDNLIVIKFTEEFSQISSDDFIKNFIAPLGTVNMVIGYDHKFGKDRLGDAEKLRELGKKYSITVTDVNAESLGESILSSTKIRNSLNNGELDIAEKFLGRKYLLCGVVVCGAQRGRTLGFPTANVKLDYAEKLVPQNGVYVVKCQLELGTYYGIMNIGFRPTFENLIKLVLEVHLFNFDFDVYNQKIKVEFLHRLRAEVKFDSKETLIHQIETDKNAALQFLNRS